MGYSMSSFPQGFICFKKRKRASKNKTNISKKNKKRKKKMKETIEYVLKKRASRVCGCHESMSQSQKSDGREGVMRS